MLAPEILESLAVLAARSASIAAVNGTMNQDNRFSQALKALELLATQRQMPLAIVGGLGAIRYGYAAATEDIDVAVADRDLARLLELAPKYGLKVQWHAVSGWHTLSFGDVEINIVPEGRRARDSAPTSIPGPEQLGVSKGLGYASLHGWAELKISSGRQKDFGHIVEVLKRTDDTKILEILRHLETVHPNYGTQFEQLCMQAAQEKQQESNRR